MQTFTHDTHILKLIIISSTLMLTVRIQYIKAQHCKCVQTATIKKYGFNVRDCYIEIDHEYIISTLHLLGVYTLSTARLLTRVELSLHSCTPLVSTDSCHPNNVLGASLQTCECHCLIVACCLCLECAVTRQRHIVPRQPADLRRIPLDSQRIQSLIGLCQVPCCIRYCDKHTK